MKLILAAMAAATVAGADAAAQARPDNSGDAALAALKPIPPIAELKARLRKRLQKFEQDGFSGVVRIDIGDKTVLRAGVGVADRATGRRFKPQTLVLINSLTKPFTATAILRLQERGLVSVSDPLSKFFPGAPPDKRDITLHQLLTHSAGFPLFAAGAAEDPDLEPLTRDQLVERAMATPLQFKPGAGFAYSNLGYSLLAAVIEVATGERYDKVLKDEVLKPAGTSRIGYGGVYDPKGAATTAEGLSIRDCCWGENGPYWNLLGNGGLVVDSDDFIRWREALAHGRIINRASLTAMTTPWVPEQGGSGEGYGWVIGKSPTRGRVELAAGGNPYFTTDMTYYRDYDMVVVVTSNSRVSAGDVRLRLVRALFDEPDGPPRS